MLIILAGFCLVFGANFYSSNLLNEANQEYSSDNSLQSYTSAWFSNMDIQFENKLLIYDPLEGMAANADLWDAELDNFTGTDGPTLSSRHCREKMLNLLSVCSRRFFLMRFLRNKLLLLCLMTEEVFSCIVSQVFTSWVLIHAPISPTGLLFEFRSFVNLSMMARLAAS